MSCGCVYDWSVDNGHFDLSTNEWSHLHVWLLNVEIVLTVEFRRLVSKVRLFCYHKQFPWTATNLLSYSILTLSLTATRAQFWSYFHRIPWCNPLLSHDMNVAGRGTIWLHHLIVWPFGNVIITVRAKVRTIVVEYSCTSAKTQFSNSKFVWPLPSKCAGS